MNSYPTELKLVGESELLIVWSDGRQRQYTFTALREACPCATCREKGKPAETPTTGLLPVITLAEAQPLKIVGMKPIGNYAYSIAFSDGHNTGIYTFELLRQLGREITSTA